MDTHEVVKGEVKRDGGFEVFQLLGKAIGQPGEAAHVHPHGEVLTLNVARGMCFGSGLPETTLRVIRTISAGLYLRTPSMSAAP